MTRLSKISCAVQLLHVSVALNLRLVTVDTTFDLNKGDVWVSLHYKIPLKP